MRRAQTVLIIALLWLTAASAQVGVPAAGPALRFAVIGDNGTGEGGQYELARQMALTYGRDPFAFVIMLGDNLYGRQEPADFVAKFERPYQPLLAAGVRFFATLGNHDRPGNRNYPPFNMHGERYYTFTRGDVRFVVLDTNELDAAQRDWARATLTAAAEPWKIVYFHHPLYSNGGRHGSNVELRVLLEPLLVAARVNVVFSGHDHHYERLRPQQGITYFVAGSGGQLRKGFTKSPLTASIYDGEQVFMVVDVAGEALTFQAISRSGRTIDSGTIPRRPTT